MDCSARHTLRVVVVLVVMVVTAGCSRDTAETKSTTTSTLLTVPTVPTGSTGSTVTRVVRSLSWSGCERPTTLVELDVHGHAWPGHPMPFTEDLLLGLFAGSDTTPPNR